MMRKIILGSKSPRRIELMKAAGLNPIIIPADIDEVLPEGIGMEDAVMFLSLKKSLFVENKVLSSGFCADDSVILTADTVVFKDEILGKPADFNDAFRMIKKIQGTSHFVATGVTIALTGKNYRETFCQVTEVFCKPITDTQIYDYISTDEPYDKAGAYGIQGIFSKYIDHYNGDFNTVVGFPWDTITEKLDSFL